MNKTKRKIFNTAVKLFAEKGYDNASTEEITAIAGVAKGSLYYHFSKKEDIFDMMLKEGMDLLKNSVEIKTKKCNTALDKVKAVILIEIKVMFKYEDFVNVVLSQIWGSEGIVQEGIENGEFYESDVEATASAIFGVTVSSLLYRLKKNREVDVERVYKGFIDSVTRTLSKNT